MFKRFWEKFFGGSGVRMPKITNSYYRNVERCNQIQKEEDIKKKERLKNE